jgi:hypothetical protein
MVRLNRLFWSVTGVGLIFAVICGIPCVQAQERAVRPEASASKSPVDRLRSTAQRQIKRGQYKTAMVTYHKILAQQRMGQTDTDVLYNLGVIAEAGRRCDKAILYLQAYQRTTVKDESSAEVTEKLNNCIQKVGRVETVVFQSAPDRVPIRVNDVFVGYSPIIGLKLPISTVVVRAEQVDYYPSTERYTVVANKPNRAMIRLSKKTYYGNLEVRAEPSEGVSVFIDKVRVGEAPYTRKNLPARRYLIHLEKEGWDRWVRYVTVQRGETLTVVVKMEDTNTEVAIPALPINED